VDNLEATLSRKLPQIVKLRLDVLVRTRNANVDGCSQWVPPEGGLGRLTFCPVDILYEMRRQTSMDILSFGQNTIQWLHGLGENAGRRMRRLRAQMDTGVGASAELSVEEVPLDVMEQRWR
jgi:hypothetical protein